MRTIHSDLITAQQSGAADPYIYLSINSTDYSSRIVSIEHREEPMRNTAVFILANSDRHFNGVNLRGKSFSPGYGYVTSSGNKYCGDGAGSEAMPTLWVKSQSMVSMEGKLVCILYCEGGWMRLREYGFVIGSDPPHLNKAFTATDTVFQLIEKALVAASFTLNSIGTQDDGIVNSYSPVFKVNPLEYDSLASMVYRLIQMTLLYLRETQSSAYELVYPQSSDAVDETYYSDQAPIFKEYVEKLNLLVPNSIVVFCNQDPDTLGWNTTAYPLITGTASDADSISQYGEVIERFTAPYIRNQTDANNRANVILQRYKYETLAGRMVLPFHDCRVELFDRVQVIDSRGL